MTPTYSAVLTPTGITVVIAGVTTSVPKDAINFKDLLAALRARAPIADVQALVSPRQVLEAKAREMGFLVEIDPETDAVGVFYDGQELHGLISERVTRHVKAGESIEPLIAFVSKATAQHSIHKVDELFNFVLHNDLPIHPDGDVLAFKSVRDTYFDHHSNTVKYALGEFVTQDRSKCNPNPSAECSTGLHVGGRKYVNTFHNHSRSRLLVVKVDPADFVAVPYKDFQKARTCKMFVYSEVFGGSVEGALQEVVATVESGEVALAAAKELEAAAAVPAPVEPKGKKTPAKSPAGKPKAPKIKKPKAKFGSVAAAAKKEAAATKVKQPKAAAASKKQVKAAALAVPKAKPAVRTFKSKNGVTVDEVTLIAKVADLGQRGAAKDLGVPRTSIQDWLKVINGPAA